jgi:type I restriction enzyme, S subunit
MALDVESRRTSSPLGPPPSGWRLAQVKDLTLLIRSGATPRGGDDVYLRARQRSALIRSQNVFDRRFSTEGLVFITDQHAAELRGAEVQPDDVLLNITGDGVTFGRACLAQQAVLPACVNQHVTIIRPDRRLCDPGYLLSYLTHPTVKAYIESFNAGGSRRAITKGHIESFVVPLPPLDEQHAIASILGTFDDKIELNRRMAETLEAMARALFRSWFVDFDPVCMMADGRSQSLPDAVIALFPGALQNLGRERLPKNWTMASLGDLCQRVAMGPFGSDIKTDTFVDSGVPVIRGGNLKRGFVDGTYSPAGSGGALLDSSVGSGPPWGHVG